MSGVAAVLLALAVLVLPSRAAGRPARAGVLPPEPTTVDEASVALTMLAAVLRGGAGTVESLEAVARLDPTGAGRDLGVVAAAHRWGEPAAQAWARVGPGWSAAASAWHAADAAGAAPAALLEDAADRLREEAFRRTEAAVHRAGVLLVLPLGACFLPGFVATTVVPVVLLLLTERMG